jgi:CelD/BcsL family acetyltransferase involved in cellulose biosynthesis
MTAPAGAADVCVRDVPCPVLTLRAGDLERSLSTRIAKQLRYYRRRAERIGPVRVEFATGATVGPMLSDLCSLHAARWAAKGATGVLSTDAVRAFHRAAAPALLKSGLLRMHALSVAGRIAAIYYGLHAGDRAFYYLGGFDPQFSAISPGTLAVASAMQAAVEEGATAFDFLAGREAYKYAWNAIDCPRINRHFSRGDPAGHTMPMHR